MGQREFYGFAGSAESRAGDVMGFLWNSRAYLSKRTLLVHGCDFRRTAAPFRDCHGHGLCCKNTRKPGASGLVKVEHVRVREF